MLHDILHNQIALAYLFAYFILPLAGIILIAIIVWVFKFISKKNPNQVEKVREPYTHPVVGKFHYDIDFDSWLSCDGFPLLQTFVWRKNSGVCNILIHTEDMIVTPEQKTEYLLTKIVQNQQQIGEGIINVLWDNLNNIGLDSGMWWQEEALESIFKETTTPQSKEELKKHLHLYELFLHGAIAEFRFRATFEDEHGLGVLYDGKSIIGVGYVNEVRLFKRRGLGCKK